MNMKVLYQRPELRGGLAELTCDRWPLKASRYSVAGQYLRSQGWGQLPCNTKATVEGKLGICRVKGKAGGMEQPVLHVARTNTA